MFRTYRRPESNTLVETTSQAPTTITPSSITKRYNTSLKRLLFTYKPRFITTTEHPYTRKTPIQFVYKKAHPSSYRRFVVQQKRAYEKPVVYRRKAKTYPKHQRYSPVKNNRLYPHGYQHQLIKHSFYGYS